jgi:hypothetical protein
VLHGGHRTGGLRTPCRCTVGRNKKPGSCLPGSL